MKYQIKNFVTEMQNKYDFQKSIDKTIDSIADTLYDRFIDMKNHSDMSEFDSSIVSLQERFKPLIYCFFTIERNKKGVYRIIFSDFYNQEYKILL